MGVIISVKKYFCPHTFVIGLSHSKMSGVDKDVWCVLVSWSC